MGGHVWFTLNGQLLELTAAGVQDRLRDVSPESLQEYGVRIGMVLYPVKQAFEVATDVPRRRFTTQVARRQFARLGFELVVTGRRRPAEVPPEGSGGRGEGQATLATEPLASGGDWHTEARVQAMVVDYLVRDGWQILSVADTARRERGIDIVAVREAETLAIEVKGFPGRDYADLRRRGEKKRANPSGQATGWYGRAVLTAMLTRSRRPQDRSIIALPDFPRYHDLFRGTAGSLEKCGVEVWWVSKEGSVTPAS
jgi:hypothetical protein